MNDEEYEDLKANFKTMKGSGKPYRFLYMPAAHDDEPLLIIRRKLPSREILELRKHARKKLLASGVVLANKATREIEFFPEEEPPAKFARHLKDTFGKHVPLLKNAVIRDAGATPDDVEEVDLEELQREQERADRKIRDVRREHQKSQRAYEKALAVASTAKDTYDKLKTQERQVEDSAQQKAFERRKALRAIEEAQGKTNWRGKLKDSAKLTIQQQQQIADDLLVEARNELLELQSIKQAQGPELKRLQEAYEALAALEAYATALEEARAEKREVDARIAQAEAAMAMRDLEDAEDAVDELVEARLASNESLKAAKKAAKTADKEASLAFDLALKAENEVARIEEQMDALDEHSDTYALLEERLHQARLDAREAMQAAEDAAAFANGRQQALQTAIVEVALEDEALRTAIEKVGSCKDTLDEKALAEIEADKQAEIARERLEAQARLSSVMFRISGSWLTEARLQRLVGEMPLSLRGLRFDFSELEITAGYAPLQFAQICRGILGQISGWGGEHGKLKDKLAVNCVEAYGTEECKRLFYAEREKVAERGREVTRAFDWDDLKKKLPDEALDQLDKDIEACTTADEIVECLLSGRDGICFGETHSADDTNQDFIADNLATFKAQGVDTLYIEHITAEYQSDIDMWMDTGTGTPIPSSVAQLLKALGAQAHGIEKIMQKAKENHIRVVCMDIGTAKGDSDDRADPGKGHGDERVRRMNAFAADTIQGDSVRTGKFITLAGAAHNTPHDGDPGPVPGIGDLLATPVVQIPKDGSSKPKVHKRD